MPLTAKGREILAKMEQRYGEKKGKNVFYASENKGTITGVHADGIGVLDRIVDACTKYDAAATLRRIGDAIGKFNAKHVVVHSKGDGTPEEEAAFRELIAEQKEDIRIAERLASMYERDGKTKEAEYNRSVAKSLKSALQHNLRNH